MCDHNLVVISINILALSTIFTISSALECRNEYESNNGEDENGMPALHRRLLSQHWITAVQRQYLDRNCLRPMINSRPKIRVNAQIQIWVHHKVEKVHISPLQPKIPQIPKPPQSQSVHLSSFQPAALSTSSKTKPRLNCSPLSPLACCSLPQLPCFLLVRLRGSIWTQTLPIGKR